MYFRVRCMRSEDRYLLTAANQTEFFDLWSSMWGRRGMYWWAMYLDQHRARDKRSSMQSSLSVWLAMYPSAVWAVGHILLHGSLPIGSSVCRWSLWMFQGYVQWLQRMDARCSSSVLYSGLCGDNRPCYEVCEMGERCHNASCSCGTRGKCARGENCQSDICMCGSKPGGCRSHEICLNGQCLCKTSSCDQCNNACKSNEICLDGKCVCISRCDNGKTETEQLRTVLSISRSSSPLAFCPFPCLNGGRCTGFYQCTCRQAWQGHRCEQRRAHVAEKWCLCLCVCVCVCLFLTWNFER